MAKHIGPHFFIGTIGDLVFYKMNDQYYVRKKSSYNKKKMQKQGAYPLMHLKQGEFGQASKLASEVYRQLTMTERKQVVFGNVTREARKLLKQGKTHEEIVAILLPFYKQEKTTVKPQEQKELAPIHNNMELPVNADKRKTEPITQSLLSNAMYINGLWYVPVTTKTFLSPPVGQPHSTPGWDRTS